MRDGFVERKNASKARERSGKYEVSVLPLRSKYPVLPNGAVTMDR